MTPYERPAWGSTKPSAGIILFILSVWILLALQGCGGSQANPVAPTTAAALAPSAVSRAAPPAPEQSARPAIANIAPSTPLAGAAAQVLYVFGTALGDGASVTFIAPSGATTTISGTALRYVSATGIIMTPVLDEVGQYAVVVTNQAGRPSDAFAFDVK